MFGRDWENGQATIVARRETGTLGQGGSQGRDTFHYIADVQPDSGAPAFRATFDERFRGTRFHYPSVGEQTAVKFHPKSQKVELDHPAMRAEMKASRDADQQQFDAIARAAPGAAVPADDALVNDAQIAAFRASRIRANIVRAQESGNRDEVERLEAMLKRVEAGDLSLPG